MSSRIYFANAFETELDGGIGAGDATITLATTTGLSFPGFLVIDDASDTIREYIFYAGISGANLTGCTRGEEGSADGAKDHDSGARVRSVFLHQLADRAFDDIEALETADADHDAAGDPHGQYLLESGFTKVAVDALGIDAATIDGIEGAAITEIDGSKAFTGEVEGIDPTTNQALATKVYVDGILPAGTRLVFDQDTAPTGWTRDTTTVNDRMIRIVTGTRADGGTWTQPGHIHTGPSHTHTGPSHTHTNPNTAGDTHSHTAGNTGLPNATFIAHDPGTGPTIEVPIPNHVHDAPTTGGDNHAHTQGNTGAGGTGNTGSSGTGATGSGATASSWRPLHRDMIIATKD